jgi:hypothetical protein
VESQAAAFADGLGCEKRLEDLRQSLFVHARTGVAYFKHNPIIDFCGSWRSKSRRFVRLSCGDRFHGDREAVN